MNNYELTTDEFCTSYRRYRKRFSWKAFKKFGYIKGQILCEKYDIVLTDYRTKRERYKDGFDSVLKKTLKLAKRLDNGKKVKIFSDSRPRPMDLFPRKEYDFDKINDKLFGKKRNIF